MQKKKQNLQFEEKNSSKKLNDGAKACAENVSRLTGGLVLK